MTGSVAEVLVLAGLLLPVLAVRAAAPCLVPAQAWALQQGRASAQR
jgi:hypothetical protein